MFHRYERWRHRYLEEGFRTGSQHYIGQAVIGDLDRVDEWAVTDMRNL